MASQHEHVDHEVQDDTGMLYDVERSASGLLSAKIRVCGYVTIDGVDYEWDRHIRVALKKVKDA